MTTDTIPKLYLMVGIPGSGKTTWVSRNFEKSIKVVSTDLIRRRIYGYFPQELKDDLEKMVWEAAIEEVRSSLYGGANTVLDSMALNTKFRSFLIHRILEGKKCNVEIIAVFMDTPLEISIKRNREREKVVNESTIKMLSKFLEPPSREEGFNRIIQIYPRI